MKDTERWAQRVLGGAILGDARRTDRLVRMAARAAETPAGKVTQVFRNLAERQASYDFLESEAVAPDCLTRTLARSTMHACSTHDRVLIVMDGTSLTLTDRAAAKGLGRIGPFKARACGLKLINALALTVEGEPLGVAEQIWWARQRRAPTGGYRRSRERESVHWRDVVARIGEHAGSLAPDTKLHFIADREGDAALLMRAIMNAGHEFTIRSNANRKVLGCRARVSVRGTLRCRKPLAKMTVALRASPRRAARFAELDVRAARLDVRMRDHHIHDTRIVPLTFIWARERRRQGGVDWMLVTNTEIGSAHDACEAVRRYARRWRIEDFHRTWKSGLCNVEDTQLRTRNAILKWATVLAAVASRAEQLRHQSRTEPDAPAETAFSRDEIDALVTLKTEIKRRTETVSADGLTVATAVHWVAEIGGWVRQKSPPGATTIGRGLERVEFAARLMARLRGAGRMR
jgi:hypothetical protein